MIVKHLRTDVQGKAPTTFEISTGEIAINTYDGKLFLKKDDGAESIVEIGESRYNYLNKTSNYSALNNDYIYASTDTGSFTITLPLNPSNNDKIIIHDIGSSFSTNNLTVDRNSETIMELSENMNIDRDNVRCTFIYINGDWRVSL